MKKFLKKVFAAVLVLPLLLSVAAIDVPWKTMAVADSNTDTVHKHKVCEGVEHDGCAHQEVEFTPFPTINAGDSLVLRGQNYYLTEDVVLSGTGRIFVDKGVTNICLNGFSIKKENGEIIDINEIDGQTAELNICDCTGNGRIENTTENGDYACISVIDDVVLNIYSGTVDGVNSGGITIDNTNSGRGGSVNIYGGAVRAKDNCAIWLAKSDTHLSVYGGEISSSDYYAVLVWGEGSCEGSTVSVYGGEIKSSAADDWEALAIRAEGTSAAVYGGFVTGEKYAAAYCEQGTLNIAGGEVRSRNTAGSCIYNTDTLVVSGGTVSHSGYYAINNYSGGNTTITGNGNVISASAAIWNRMGSTAEINGGNINSEGIGIINEGTFTVSGGEITSKANNIVQNGKDTKNAVLEISGGNFSLNSEAQKSQTYIANYSTLNLSGSPTFDNTSLWLCNDNNINITGALAYSAPCAVYIEGDSPRIITNGFSQYMSGKTPSDYFKSPYSLCTITKSDSGEALLRLFKITFDANGGACDTADTDVNDDGKASVLPEAVWEGYTFDGWFTAENGGEKITNDTVFTDDATLYAHWSSSGCAHKWSDAYKYSDEKHWIECELCGAKKDEAAHQWEEDVNAGVQPDCTNAGSKTYSCTTCQASKTEPVGALGHSFSKDWQSNDEEHWHICERCNTEKSDISAHIWDNGTVTKEPSAGQIGEKRFECTVCGAFKTEILPETSAGNITKDVQSGENVPETVLTTPTKELIPIVLTSEEQQIVNSGTDIRIILTVDDATNSVPAQDKAAVENRIGNMTDYKLGQYLDIKLLKIIEDRREKITETNAPITVMFTIPEALRAESRVYSVIRVHNGKTDVLNDLDSDINTVTIETDKFSTYALAYSEKTAPPQEDNTGNNPGESGSDNGGSDSGEDEKNPSEGGHGSNEGVTAPSEGGHNSGGGDTVPGENVTASGEGGNNTVSGGHNSSEAGVQDKSDSSPDTGDNSIPMGRLIIIILAAAGVLFIAAGRKKQY